MKIVLRTGASLLDHWNGSWSNKVNVQLNIDGRHSSLCQFLTEMRSKGESAVILDISQLVIRLNGQLRSFGGHLSELIGTAEIERRSVKRQGCFSIDFQYHYS